MIFALTLIFAPVILGFYMLRKNMGDWEVVWSDIGSWVVGNKIETSEYYIEYSKSKQEFRVRSFGYCPKDHPYLFDNVAEEYKNLTSTELKKEAQFV